MTVQANNISNVKLAEFVPNIPWTLDPGSGIISRYCYSFGGRLLCNGRDVPTPNSDPGWFSLAQGTSHTCGLYNGNYEQIYCWGNNESGQLGDGSSQTPPDPLWPVEVQPSFPGSSVDYIVASGNHTCALIYNQATSIRWPYCWGETSIAGPVYFAEAVPQGEVPYGASFSRIALGRDFACGIADGEVYCWGDGYSGQLGDVPQSLDPVRVNTGSANPFNHVDVFAHEDSVCATVDWSAELYCWGRAVSTPLLMQGRGEMPTDTVIRFVSIGHHSTCALSTDNQIYCWGDNVFGQLGNGTSDDAPVGYGEDYYTPTTMQRGVMPADVDIADVVPTGLGGNGHCAIMSNGHVYCWGSQDGINGDIGCYVGNESVQQDRYTPAYILNRSITPMPAVRFGGQLASNVSVMGEGFYYKPTATLTMKTPAHPVGPVAVSITNADGQSSSNIIATDDSNKYTYVSVPDAPNKPATATQSTGS